MHSLRSLTWALLVLYVLQDTLAELNRRNRSCPVPVADCECQYKNNRTSLEITCLNTMRNTTELLPAMDALLTSLANNSLLTKLTIHYTPLTQVPTALCNMTSLENLALDNNRLLTLPDNCFTSLKQLRTFSASGNSIRHLQVR